MATKGDFLQTLASWIVLSISQAAALLDTSDQSVRKWVRALPKRSIQSGRPTRGRPEQWIVQPGFRGSTWHQWHVTEFAVRVLKLCRTYGISFTPIFSSPTPCRVSPDCIFTLCLAGERPLLFFLEIDTGTEPFTRSGTGTAIQSKIEAYAELRASDQYRAYVQEDEPVRGFRVLLVSLPERRHKALCREVERHAAEFVWVTSWDAIEEHGVFGEIWCRGGRGERRESILGTKRQALAK